jgi:hypothetical protein
MLIRSPGVKLGVSASEPSDGFHIQGALHDALMEPDHLHVVTYDIRAFSQPNPKTGNHTGH